MNRHTCLMAVFIIFVLGLAACSPTTAASTTATPTDATSHWGLSEESPWPVSSLL